MNASKRILVVEDERIVARDIQRSLTDLGYQVPATAATSEQAIRLVSEHCPDLVLMDIRLKGEVDGIDTAALLKAKFEVPVVYLTAYADALTVERAKATEPLGYVLKPLRPNELRSTVELALYRHGMEKRLREREHWLTTTLSSIGDAVVSTDEKGFVTYLNPVAEALLGVRAPEARGRYSQQLVKLLNETSGLAIEDAVTTALRELKSVQVEGVLIGADGCEHLLVASTSPIVDERVRVLGAVMVFQDVTEQKRIQRRLEHADRLASTAAIASGIAHEVNNPLAFVVANLAFVLDAVRNFKTSASVAKLGPLDDWCDEVEMALTEAQQGAARVCQIVADLRVFTASDPGALTTGMAGLRESVDLGETLDWALEMSTSALRFVNVVRAFEPVPKVTGEATRLGLAFVNILVNAAESMAGEGHEPRQVTLTTRTNQEGDAMIEIRDTGVGMTEQVSRRALEPFFTTKEAGRGRGLGLSICHGIVSSMGGVLELESSVDRGTVARVRLPARFKTIPPVAPPIVDRATRGHVMVVDDEVTMRSVLQRVLGPHHFLTCPKTSPEALALIDGGMRFDLILCDVMMPLLSGPAFHDELLRRHPDQARRTAFLTGGAVSP
ncbi:MAG TPA: response regulator, partial [Polyangiaceae bacterium]